MKTEKLDDGALDTLTPDEVRASFDKNEIILIDVRTPVEYAFEHIRGALLAPLASIDPDKLPGQDGKRIVFHCGSGMRSRTVAQKCLAAGFDRIAHMEGGFGAWKKGQLPYLALDPATGGQVEKP